MTLRQKAYRMIDDLTDENVRLMIVLMEKLSHNQPKQRSASLGGIDPENDGVRALKELEKLRAISRTYYFGDFETEREAAMKEKYGDF